MAVLDLIAAIAAAGVAVTVLFLAHGRHGDDRGGPRAELVRYFGIAALAALACGLLNVLEEMGGATFAAAVGNATNVFAPGLVWAGARRLNGRPAIGAVSAGAGAILMLGATFLMPLDDATLVKTAALVGFAALGAVEVRRRPLGAVSGTALLSWTLGLYALYNLSRLVVVALAGMNSPAWQAASSSELTSLISAVAIVAVAIGAVRMGRELDDDPAPGTRAHDRGALRRDAAALLAGNSDLETLIVRLPELDLIRTAHTSACADEILATLVSAAHGSITGAAAGIPARDTVFVLLPAHIDTALAEDSVRAAFAAAMPGIGYDDTPDLSFEHRLVDDVEGLSLLMESSRLRPRHVLPL